MLSLFCAYSLQFYIQLVKDKGDAKDLAKGVSPDIIRKLKVPAIKLITRIASIVLFFLSTEKRGLLLDLKDFFICQ